MTDQNNSGNNPVPAQTQPTQQVPTPSNNWNGNSTTYTLPTGAGQWITYTISGIDLGNTITVNPVDAPVEKKAKKKSDKDGCFCKRCKEWSEFSEPNQEDGTFVCYSCRRGW